MNAIQTSSAFAQFQAISRALRNSLIDFDYCADFLEGWLDRSLVRVLPNATIQNSEGRVVGRGRAQLAFNAERWIVRIMLSDGPDSWVSMMERSRKGTCSGRYVHDSVLSRICGTDERGHEWSINDVWLRGMHANIDLGLSSGEKSHQVTVYGEADVCEVDVGEKSVSSYQSVVFSLPPDTKPFHRYRKVVPTPGMPEKTSFQFVDFTDDLQSPDGIIRALTRDNALIFLVERDSNLDHAVEALQQAMTFLFARPMDIAAIVRLAPKSQVQLRLDRFYGE